MSRYIYEGDIYGSTQAEDIKLKESLAINNKNVANVNDAISELNDDLNNKIETEIATDFNGAESPEFQQTFDDIFDDISELKGDLENGKVGDKSIDIIKLNGDYTESTYNLIRVEGIKTLDNNISVSNEKDTITITSNGYSGNVYIYTDRPTLQSGQYYILFDSIIFEGIQFHFKTYFTDGTKADAYPKNTRILSLNLTSEKTLDYFVIIVKSEMSSFTGKIWLVNDSNYSKPYIEKYISKLVTNDTIHEVLYTPKKLFEGEKILTYGDSQTGMNRWQPYLSGILGCDVIAYGFGGFPLAFARNKDLSEGFGLATEYNVNNLITKISEENPTILLIMGGTNDMEYDGTGTPQSDWNTIQLGDNSDTTNENYKGALKYIVKRVLSEYPNLKVIIMSPIGGNTKQSGVNLETPITNALGYTLGDFAKASKEIADYIGVGFIDVYNCGITIYNSATYIADGIHINEDLGGEKVANYVANGLMKYSSLMN